MQDDQINKVKQLIDESSKVLILQADNPDGDSLGSAIALEQILMVMGKDTVMICGIGLPSYLSYIPGWDRVERDIPNQFDLVIIVDTSSLSLLENLAKTNLLEQIKKRPIIVLDHHATPATIDFAAVAIIDPESSATGELIFKLAKKLNLEMNLTALKSLTVAILSDTLGLTTENTSAQTVYAVAEMVEKGVSLSELEASRREIQNKSPELVRYKGELLKRIEYYDNDRIAFLTIPWEEIEHYSPMYNPSMLVIEDMRLTTNTKVAIVIKLYPDGKITGKIRTNYKYPIAAKLAEAFNGGGHEYASGFKLTDNRSPEELTKSLIAKASELMDNM